MPEATTTSNDTAVAGRNRTNEGTFNLPQLVQWWLIIKHKNKHTLHLLNLMDSQTGMTLMHILHKEYKSTKKTSHWYHTHPQIEEATLSPLCIGDLEAQDYPRQVLVDSSTPRPDLTEAFHNPDVLRGTQFMRLNAQFNISEQNSGIRKAILIKTEASKYIVVSALAVMVLVAIVAGVVVGFAFHNVSWGLATCTVIVGICALVLVFLFGMKILG